MKCDTRLSGCLLVFALVCQQSYSLCDIFQSKAFSEQTSKGCDVRVQFEVTDACLQGKGHVESLKVKESRGFRLFCVINYAEGACTHQTGCTCSHNSTRFALERKFRPWQPLHWTLSWTLQNGDSVEKTINIDEPCSQGSMPPEEPSTAATQSVSQQRDEQTATHTTEVPGNETEENVTPHVQVMSSSAEQLGADPTTKSQEATEEEVTPSLTKTTKAVTRIRMATSVMTTPWFGYALLSFIFGCILLAVVAMFAVLLKRRGRASPSSLAPNNVEADVVVYRRPPRAFRLPRSSSLLAPGRCSSVPCLSVAIPTDGYPHAYSCLALDRHVLSEDLHLYSLPNSVCSSASDEDAHVYSSPLLPRRAKSNEYISS